MKVVAMSEGLYIRGWSPEHQQPIRSDITKAKQWKDRAAFERWYKAQPGSSNYAPVDRIVTKPTQEVFCEVRLLDGSTLRMMRDRSGSYDVIRNITGITWRYVKKRVSEETAREAFDALAMMHGTTAPYRN